MAAAGVRSSGAGLEMVPFASPVPAVGRFDIWFRNVDRQLMSAIANDVETATAALRKHSKVASGPLLHIQTTEAIGSIKRASAANTDIGSSGLQRTGVSPPVNEGGKQSESGQRSYPSIQGQLLARSAHWTAAVETALTGTPFASSPPPGGASGGRGQGARSASRSPESLIQEILSSVLLHVHGWAEELRRPGGMTAYFSLMCTALTTQALQQRDVVEELLKKAPRVTAGGSTTDANPATTAAKGGRATSPKPITSSATTAGGGEENAALPGASEWSPFLWLCHLRHYYVSPSEDGGRNGRPRQTRVGVAGGGGGGGAGGGRASAAAAGEGDNDKDGEYEQELPPPPPPLIRVGLGPWNVPYGFEYAGNLEKLWLTPLSERCLLHAVHSAKVNLPMSMAGRNGRSAPDNKTCVRPAPFLAPCRPNWIEAGDSFR